MEENQANQQFTNMQEAFQKQRNQHVDPKSEVVQHLPPRYLRNYHQVGTLTQVLINEKDNRQPKLFHFPKFVAPALGAF